MSRYAGRVLNKTLEDIRAAGTYKKERVITSAQAADIVVDVGGRKVCLLLIFYGCTDACQGVINFCANNYLGLANNKELIESAKQTMDSHGLGMASVRFICGTQDLHKTLEKRYQTHFCFSSALFDDFFRFRIAQFHGTEDTILYSSAFDANGGLFETILGEEDAVCLSFCLSAAVQKAGV